MQKEKVEILRPVRVGGKEFNRGDTAEFSSATVEELEKLGYARRLGRDIEEVPATGTEQRGINVEEFLKESQATGAMFIRTSELEEGDEFEVLGPGEVDTETFDKPYIVLPVLYKGLERRLRLGPQNAARIRKKLGTTTAEWVGKKIRVLTLGPCPGLSRQRGERIVRAILEGVKE